MTGLSSETTAEQDRLGRRCQLCEHLMMVVGSPKERVQRTSAREHRKSPQAGSNHRPFAYEASALPLSYRGLTTAIAGYPFRQPQRLQRIHVDCTHSYTSSTTHAVPIRRSDTTDQRVAGSAELATSPLWKSTNIKLSRGASFGD